MKTSKRILGISFSLLINVMVGALLFMAVGFDAGISPSIPVISYGVGITALGMAIPELLPTNILAYTFVSVPKESDNPGRPVGKNDMLIVFRWSDIDVDNMPTRDSGGVRISGNLVFLINKTAVEVYMTPSTVNCWNQSTGDTDKKGFIQNLEGEIPGDGLSISEFLENNVNQNLGAIVRFCDGRTPRLFGTPCVPLQFEVEGQNNNEANFSKLTLKSVLPGPVIAHYAGTIPAIDTDSGSGSGV